MKNFKRLTNVIALTLTLASSASIQAIELVEVDASNNSVISIDLKTELAQSLKGMSKLTLNVEESAEAILMIQNEKQFPSTYLETTLVAVAE
jgi:hypothetical protein